MGFSKVLGWKKAFGWCFDSDSGFGKVFFCGFLIGFWIVLGIPSAVGMVECHGGVVTRYFLS